MRAEPRQPAQPMRWQAASWLTRAEREAEEQPKRMLDALPLKPGETVADVGARRVPRLAPFGACR
jgi:hypothetical protein